MANRHIECFFFNKIIFVVDFCFLFVYNNNDDDDCQDNEFICITDVHSEVCTRVLQESNKFKIL